MKVGEYVRTRWGCIAKFEGIHGRFYEFDNIIMDESSAVREELFVDIVEKTSPNIIGLIQVGDYVNGMQVTRICFDEDGERILNLSNCILELMDEDIKSIVTKEQFERMEYKLC